MRNPLRLSISIQIAFLLMFSSTGWAAGFKYMRSGNAQDVQTHPTAGTALMGGGSDLDAAFKWLCEKADGGDFLILRARGDDAYNPYVQKLCPLNSVATLIIGNRKTAQDPRVAQIIRSAEAVFIAGGDQARYVHYWQGTPVETAINEGIAAGKPIGGTSAGLAILGQFSFGALINTTTSPQALKNPYDRHVTLVKAFLVVPHMENVITDSHWVARDRLGRTLIFLARIMQDGWSTRPLGIPIDEKAAVLVEASGQSTVVGQGAAYFLRPTHPPEQCVRKQKLTFTGIEAYRAPVGSHFDLAVWQGDGGVKYELNVKDGIVSSTQAGGKLY